MSEITSDSAFAMGIAPLDVYDANGMLIRRAITAFDIELGRVESQILDRQGEVHFIGDVVLKRVETYPAPLMWKTITQEEAKARRHLYLDLSGR